MAEGSGENTCPREKPPADATISPKQPVPAYTGDSRGAARRRNDMIVPVPLLAERMVSVPYGGTDVSVPTAWVDVGIDPYGIHRKNVDIQRK